MLDAARNSSSVTDLLAVLGSAGTLVGATVGAIVGATDWRRAFESLAVGAAAGAAVGYLAAFAIYDGVHVLG